MTYKITQHSRTSGYWVRPSDKLPTYADITDVGYDGLVAKIKLFNPAGGQTWYIVADEGAGRVFGLADLGFGSPELGTFSLDEMAELRLPWGLHIERDLYFSPTPVKDLVR